MHVKMERSGICVLLMLVECLCLTPAKALLNLHMHSTCRNLQSNLRPTLSEGHGLGG